MQVEGIGSERTRLVSASAAGGVSILPRRTHACHPADASEVDDVKEQFCG